MSAANSGERTRTSDPRLMNPLPNPSNMLTDRHFGKVAEAGYTPGYTGISNSDPDLLRLIKVWSLLPEHLRQTIRTLLVAAGVD